jgi:hypothetical protein
VGIWHERIETRPVSRKEGVIEDCLALSVKSVHRGENRHVGSVHWRCGTEVVATIKYEINLWSAERGDLWLRYFVDGEPVHLPISMTSTAVHLGGRRWWFICPVTAKRVEKLYLPDGATQFAGRKAHDLTYTSCQQSGREKRFWHRIDKLLGRKDPAHDGPNCR